MDRYLTDEEIIKFADKFLELFIEDELPQLHHFDKVVAGHSNPDKLRTTVLELLLTHDVIRRVAPNAFQYKLTSFGYEIKRNGGWQKHLEKIDELDLLNRNQIKSIIETNKSVIETNRIQKKLLWLTFILSVLSAVFSFLQFVKPDPVLPKDLLELIKHSLKEHANSHKPQQQDLVK